MKEPSNETEEILKPKGLLEQEVMPASHLNQLTKKEARHVLERRQEILKKGSIPEFVQINDAIEFY